MEGVGMSDEPNRTWLWFCMSVGTLIDNWGQGYEQMASPIFWMGWALFAHWSFPYVIRFLRRGFAA